MVAPQSETKAHTAALSDGTTSWLLERGRKFHIVAGARQDTAMASVAVGLDLT
jgi:hypothetical protein